MQKEMATHPHSLICSNSHHYLFFIFSQLTVLASFCKYDATQVIYLVKIVVS